MSPEGELLAEAVPTCPHCGAEAPPEAKFCWLCGSKQAVERPPPVTAVKTPPLEPGQRLLVWSAVVVVAVIGYGVVRSQDQGIAALYLIAVVPTLLVVLIGTTSARRRGRPWSPGKTAAVAATTAATTVASALFVALAAAAVAALMVVAMVIALFATCMAAAGGHF